MSDTRYLFFTGKGGVGKTSLAAAKALELAEAGKSTLIISTDPASNLDEVFGVSLGSEPTSIPGAPGLSGANLDPEAAAAAYRERMVAPYRGKLPELVIRSMEEQFSGACTTEIAAFDEFVALMADPGLTEQFDHVVFDTAPTGHTLRLLSLPGAWADYLETTTSESSCLGPLAGLKEKQGLYAAALSALSDGDQTTLILVARPDDSSLREASRTASELGDLGIKNVQLIVNAVLGELETNDATAVSMKSSQAASLGRLPENLQGAPRREVPLLGGNMVGLDALRALRGKALSGVASAVEIPVGLSFSEFVDHLSRSGHGVIMTLGKGGVGKTTVAAKIAEELASRGHRVQLTTTDPAGDIQSLVEGQENLSVHRIDPAAEVAAYSEAALAKARETMEPDAVALLEEDMRSPCTEEIAVFRAFAEAVAGGGDHFVVIDTAPTGHTILLMDATEAYHREIARTQSDAPESVRQLLPRLRDPEFTKMVLVALPEPTPVHEAMRLQADLARAGISPAGWVINRSLALTGTTEPVLRAKAAAESGPVDEVRSLSLPTTVLPWHAAGDLIPG
ncbi:MAG: arsenical pump-driving ATPase [Armatimonadetes bacterium]|nr:arsenical pump-driving ATPase [Armatimonadota bacterium]